MRTCPAFSVRGHLTYYSRRGVGHDLSWLAAGKASVHSRFYATAAVAHEPPSILKSPFTSSTTQPLDRLGHASTLTALHKARELVARILPPQSPELSFWNDILRDVSDETSRCSLTSNEEFITIVVYSVDEFSGGEALVSALLQDPFSPETENGRITRRWEGREQDTRLDIEYALSSVGNATSTPVSSEGAFPSSSQVIRLSSSFLTSLPSPVRLIEVRQGRDLSPDHLRLLYTAHIPIVLLNPLTTPLAALSPYTKSTVLPYPLPPHSLLLITSPSPISTSSSVPPPIFELGVSADRVFLVDPARALSSIRALRTNSSDALHVQRYADDALGSGLSALKRQLQSVPTAVQKGDALVSTAIGVLRNGLHSAEAELHEAADLARVLRSEAERAREDARRAVFGPAHEPVRLTPSAASTFKTGTASTNKVRAAMAHADGTVQPVLDNLTWWRVLWAPDDAGWRIRQAVRDAWVGSIAGGLLPALAALPSTQSRLADSARERVTTALPPALRSRVLLNALEQRAHAPSFALEPRALLAPLERRFARLDAGPTAALARAAQVLLLRAAGSTGAGVGAGALVLAHGVGEATGAGLFIAAAGVRWAIGRWDKARRAWRGDWVRVKEAAERDVQTALDEALETQVLIVPVHAADGVEEIIAKREDEIGQMRREVDKLDTEVSDSQNLTDRRDIHS
ncbi:hypothetical protein EDB84DRAFT_742205 [Lactarius hengduanensis]|nr:hypothetical protein EDB84DRAFT_742205 [Lactarius hengduanensis]